MSSESTTPAVFPNELLAVIASHVTERACLLRIRAVSAAFRHVTDDELFRDICLTYPEMPIIKLVGVQEPHIARCVRSISYRTTWDLSRYPESAPLEQVADLLGNLRIFPRLHALSFEFSRRLGHRDMHPSTETLSGLLCNFSDSAEPPSLALSSFELWRRPPDPAAIAALPPALFSQLTRLVIQSTTHDGRTRADPAGDALWNRLHPSVIISPARHTLTYLDLNFQHLIPVFPHHHDLVCPRLHVLKLQHVVFGAHTESTESFILRHARTLEVLHLRQCPMLLGVNELPLAGAAAWSIFWNALRERALRLLTFDYEEINSRKLNLDNEHCDLTDILQWRRFCFLEEGLYKTRWFDPFDIAVQSDWIAFCDLQHDVAARQSIDCGSIAQS